MKTNQVPTTRKKCTNVLYMAMFAFAATSAFAWGPGHDTVARETLKFLPGEWGKRLRDGSGGKIFLSSAHAPDDMKTRLSDRA